MPFITYSAWGADWKVSSPPVSWSTLLWPLGCLHNWTAALSGDEQTELGSTDVISVSCKTCSQCPDNWAETSREAVACSEAEQVEACCNFYGEGCVHKLGLWLTGWHSWLTVCACVRKVSSVWSCWPQSRRQNKCILLLAPLGFVNIHSQIGIPGTDILCCPLLTPPQDIAQDIALARL